MTTLLIDSFTGSGTLPGHTPDTPFGGYSWTANAGTMNLTGGKITPTSTNVANITSVRYGAYGTGIGLSQNIYCEVKFTTGPSVGGALDHEGLTVDLLINGFEYIFSVYGSTYFTPGTTTWYARLANATEQTVPAIAANTEYTAVFNKTGAGVTLNILGLTLTDTLSDADSSGLTWMELKLGGTMSVGNLLLADAVPASVLTASITAPAGTVTGAFSSPLGISSSLLAPAATLKAYFGGSLKITPPSALLSGSILNTAGNNAALFTAPPGKALAYFGANAKLAAPAWQIASALTSTALLRAGISAPSGYLAAAVTVSQVMRGAMTSPMGALVGYGGALISITTPMGTLQSSFNGGAVMRGAITAPLFDLSATLTRNGKLSADLLSPMLQRAGVLQAWLIAPGAQLTAIGTAVVAVSYEAYALNLKHNPTPGVEPVDELTRYTNYPFDRIVRYENSYFGMNSTGLYLLEGTTDFAEPTPTKVQWGFKTGLTDFDSPNLKTVNWAYFGGRMAPAATISIHYGDTGEQNYAYSTPRGAEAQNYRQPFGRGIKSRYYAVEAEGSGALSIDSMMFDIASMARKV